jgi:DNA-binding NtrC family response regulator
LNVTCPTIALIEDDPLVRTALARAIDDADYNVISAASGPEGLGVLNDHGQAIDLAIIDIVLPGRIDGIAVVREAKRLNPNLRVIFTSGHPPPAGVDLTPWGEFLPKPTRVTTLLATIARQLGKP